MLDASAPIEVGNAGLVLLAPFTPRLFALLGLLSDDRFVDHGAAERSAYLLQVAASTSEYSISPDCRELAQLLCGLPVDHAVTRAAEASEKEASVIESCLHAIITQWSILGSTSTAGLRETFLSRRGRLERTNDGWQLTVEAKRFDMLLDRLPWDYSPVRLPWMAMPIEVRWR